ncbi:putative P-loop containing nucleoside triphosphate hydrolase, leucine-rich repeat domain superfamily [Helianthus debilis subsp. tardiflorus]
MAELVLSAFLGVLFEKLASATVRNIARYKGVDVKIKKWRRSLTQIHGVLVDASQKEITSAPVKRWLNDLQHLAYDIDDVLDGWVTEAMHPEYTNDSEGITSKVRKLIPSCCTNITQSSSMHGKLDGISTKLQELLEEKVNLGLRVEEGPRSKDKNRRLQTSMFDASSIVGRQAEKEALVNKLLDGESCGQSFSIVPIVGMGGVGKTTLARLVYNEKQVQDHFQLKAWVCVSDDFDSFAISKVIFQSVTGENKDFADLNLLQVALRDHLREKRFLLVLDDVWSENFQDWETLVGPFHACGSGSKIIMTTRKNHLLKKLGQDHLNQLENLSHDDAMALVALYALGVNNFDSHLSLKTYGEGIVKKCNGLPLAVIAIGRLLRTKRSEEDSWKEVLDSEIWKLPVESEIVPALKLSYHDLSATLKQLFAYCSLFPKDFLFDKEELVLLWMAEGFFPSDSIEQNLGHEFFEELLSRSFFQHAPNHESLFVMHDLMNDLATSVATEFSLRLDNEPEKNIRMEMLEKYRHLSFVREEYVTYKKFEAFKRAKSLRTFLATSVGEVDNWRCFNLSNKILSDLLPELPLLRVLCLSDFYITEVPESIGTLRHLRYLNLSRTSISHLPEKVCTLYNLQTLILFGCSFLTKLPNNFLKLKNLRHLDVRNTRLLFQMLLGIGELKSLHISLSKIDIGGESGMEIAKLKDFKNLCGKISIVGMDKVQNANYAREANFSHKRLSELELVWNDELYDSRNERLEKEVLDELKPCNDKLIQLEIRSYGGLEFPNWVGDPLFLHLKHVSIRGCKRCTSLPPLGQLQSLKKLFVEGLHGVEVVGSELFGTSHAFPSLEILNFKDMRGWKKWSGVVFPCLQELKINNCPNLVEVTLEALPSLNVLQIYNCPNLVEVALEALPSLNELYMIKCDSSVLRKLVEVASTITKLEIKHIWLNDVVWRGIIEFLGDVEELSIANCHGIRYLVESDATASKVLVKLRKLEVWRCNSLVCLGAKEEDKCKSSILTSLRILKVFYCVTMKRCSCPDGIEELTVEGCSSMTVVSFPNGGQERLRSLEIRNCRELSEREWEWGGQRMNNRSSMPMLEYVHIYNWPNLKSVINLNCLVHLTELRIEDCESLESFPDKLASLKKLEINNCPKLDVSLLRDNLTSLDNLKIRNCPRLDASSPSWVWPPSLRSLHLEKLKKPISEWGPQNFPSSLVELYLHGGEDGVCSCSQLFHLFPSSLTYLEIHGFEKLELVSEGLQHLTSIQRLTFFNCPNLKKVSLPQHLTSLQHLSFSECPNMMDLPEMLLPSLLSLRIWGDCPEGLKERCSKNGSYWPLISQIPCIVII